MFLEAHCHTYTTLFVEARGGVDTMFKLCIVVSCMASFDAGTRQITECEVNFAQLPSASESSLICLPVQKVNDAPGDVKQQPSAGCCSIKRFLLSHAHDNLFSKWLTSQTGNPFSFPPFIVAFIMGYLMKYFSPDCVCS